MAKRGQDKTKTSGSDADYGVDYASFAESMMDGSLYGVGAFFCDEHPDLIDSVIAESCTIEEIGLQAYAAANRLGFEECLQTLITGLAVRYYKAIVG